MIPDPTPYGRDFGWRSRWRCGAGSSVMASSSVDACAVHASGARVTEEASARADAVGRQPRVRVTSTQARASRRRPRCRSPSVAASFASASRSRMGRCTSRRILEQPVRDDSRRGIQQHDVAHRALLAVRAHGGRPAALWAGSAAEQVVDVGDRDAEVARVEVVLVDVTAADLPDAGCGRWWSARRARRRRGTPARWRRACGRRR